MQRKSPSAGRYITSSSGEEIFLCAPDVSVFGGLFASPIIMLSRGGKGSFMYTPRFPSLYRMPEVYIAYILRFFSTLCSRAHKRTQILSIVATERCIHIRVHRGKFGHCISGYARHIASIRVSEGARGGPRADSLESASSMKYVC